MSEKIKAKMKCNEIVKTEYSETAVLVAVSGTSEENKTFSDATPSAHLNIIITNESAYGFFVPGREYVLDFTPADAPAQAIG